MERPLLQHRSLGRAAHKIPGVSDKYAANTIRKCSDNRRIERFWMGSPDLESPLEWSSIRAKNCEQEGSVHAA